MNKFEKFKQHYDGLQDCVIRDDGKIVGFDVKRVQRRIGEFMEFLELMKGYPTLKMYVGIKESEIMTGEEIIQFVNEVCDFISELNKVMITLIK